MSETRLDHELQGAGGPLLITDTTERTFDDKISMIVVHDATTEIDELKDENGDDLIVAHSSNGPYNIASTPLPVGLILKARHNGYFTTCKLGAGIVACYQKYEWY